MFSILVPAPREEIGSERDDSSEYNGGPYRGENAQEEKKSFRGVQCLGKRKSRVNEILALTAYSWPVNL